MSEFRREVCFEPGFDHRNDPDPKQREYGCHGMDIRFLLHGPRGSVQFLLYTGWLPGQSYYRPSPLRPTGADVGYHWDSPQYDGQSPRECTVRPGGRCYYDGSGLAAEELFERFTAESDAAVWSTLEQRYADLDGRREAV